MAKHRDLRRRRRALWEKDNRCHWCGIETIWSENSNGINPADSATLDHIYSKYHPKRLKPNTTREIRYVLACQQCNHKRGREEDALRNPQPEGFWSKKAGDT